MENKIKVPITTNRTRVTVTLGNVKRGGPVKDEQIEKAVNEYFVENPVKDGEDGGYYKPFLANDGTLMFTPSKNGMLPLGSVGNIKGPKGDKGDSGYTPQKGIDYFDGVDGYTPKKGIDYFDGKDGADGYTPQKNIDYFDGKDGADGKDGGYYIPSLTGGELIFTPTVNGMKPVGSVGNIKGADGAKGADGKTAYAYAQEGGYEGTEEEFAEKLAVNPDWIATKKVDGGEETYISQQTLTSGMWSKLQMNFQVDLDYDVYFNGEVYVCRARTEDGGVYLGNVTLMNSTSTKPHNNEPFCIYWAGAGATGGFFYKSSTVSYPITLKVTSHADIVYDKMPKEYLPEGVAFKSDIPEAIDGKDGKDGADGERGYSVLRVTTALSSYTTTTGGFTPKYRIALSTVLAESGAEDVRIGDTILRNYYTYRVGYVDGGYVYTTTYASIRGSAGTSVTITDVTESTADGGSNVVTFSDGKTLTIKNGTKGSNGDNGDDYVLTEADKNEIAQKAAALVPGGGGGGTSIDVTAEVGQTIIVKEVDANGKPTKWESADYQPRTHWDEIGEIFPETEGVFVEESGFFLLGEITNTVSAANHYTVSYNGVEYTCSPVIGDAMWYMGNMGALDESMPNTGEPFIIGCSDGVSIAMPLDGAESVTVAIYGDKTTKIPDKYINETPIIEAAVNQATSQSQEYTDGKIYDLRYEDEVFDLTTIVDVPLVVGEYYEITDTTKSESIYRLLQHSSNSLVPIRIKLNIDGVSETVTSAPMLSSSSNGMYACVAIVPNPFNHLSFDSFWALNIRSAYYGNGGYNTDIQLNEYIAPVPTDDHINSLIDAKLGVIENGSY